MIKSPFFALSLALLAGACMVGPDFTQPETDASKMTKVACVFAGKTFASRSPSSSYWLRARPIDTTIMFASISRFRPTHVCSAVRLLQRLE